MKSTIARKLRQVPQGYLVIEVDPYKKKHAAVAIAQDFTTLVKFKFDNSREGFEMMLQRFRVEMAKAGCRSHCLKKYSTLCSLSVKLPVCLEPGLCS